jgi:hypothetical protein
MDRARDVEIDEEGNGIDVDGSNLDAEVEGGSSVHRPAGADVSTLPNPLAHPHVHPR